MRRRLPSAPLAAGVLILAWAVVAASGSRALGGAVLLAGALALALLWRARHGARTAAQLLAAGLAAFVLSHVLALALGAWPAVLIAAGAMAWATWAFADAREGRGTPSTRVRGRAVRPPAR
jgi:hypothetical protein